MAEFRLRINEALKSKADAFDTRQKFLQFYDDWESDRFSTPAEFHQMITRVGKSKTLTLRFDMIPGLFLSKLETYLSSRKSLNFVVFGVWEDDNWRAGVDLRSVTAKVNRFYGTSATVVLSAEKTSLDAY